MYSAATAYMASPPDSRTKRPFDLAPTPSAVSDKRVRLYSIESETPCNKQFRRERSVSHGIDERYPFSTASQAQGTVLANVPMEQEFGTFVEQSLTIGKGPSNGPILGGPLVRTPPFAEDSSGLELMADSAGKQEYLGPWLYRSYSSIHSNVAMTPRNSPRLLQNPSPSTTPENPSLERVRTLGTQLMETQIGTPPLSYQYRSSNGSSEAHPPSALAITQAVQEGDNLAALGMLSETNRVLWAGFDRKDREACKILYVMPESGKVIANVQRQNQNLDSWTEVGSSLFRNLPSQEERSFDQAIAIEEQTNTALRNTFTEENHQAFLVHISEDDSDCDTWIEDRSSESVESPQ
jgi:hypothetical protein